MTVIGATATVFALLAGVSAAQGRAADLKNETVQTSDTVPDALQVPAGEMLTVSARGVGVQIYECSAAKDDATHFSWSLKAPEAILRSKSGRRLGRHYAGPTWEATDGSRVVGEVVAKADAPRAAAIPWLLLHAKSTSGPGLFSSIGSIQRIHTVGGKAPTGGCDQAHAGRETRVRYSAEYRFYSPGS
jgi:hypothetical protein